MRRPSGETRGWLQTGHASSAGSVTGIGRRRPVREPDADERRRAVASPDRDGPAARRGGIGVGGVGRARHAGDSPPLVVPAVKIPPERSVGVGAPPGEEHLRPPGSQRGSAAEYPSDRGSRHRGGRGAGDSRRSATSFRSRTSRSSRSALERRANGAPLRSRRSARSRARSAGASGPAARAAACRRATPARRDVPPRRRCHGPPGDEARVLQPLLLLDRARRRLRAETVVEVRGDRPKTARKAVGESAASNRGHALPELREQPRAPPSPRATRGRPSRRDRHRAPEPPVGVVELGIPGSLPSSPSRRRTIAR